MEKIIIDNNKLKTLVNEDWQSSVIAWAHYRGLNNSKKEILENNNHENELIKNIQFLGALKDKLNTNYILNIKLKDINNTIQKKCWKWRELIVIPGMVITGSYYFDENLKNKILNDYNKLIKYSNQKEKQKITNDYFKTKAEKKEYKEWKQNYFKTINENITNNIIETGIDAQEYFKSEINSVNPQNQSSTCNEYNPLSL